MMTPDPVPPPPSSPVPASELSSDRIRAIEQLVPQIMTWTQRAVSPDVQTASRDDIVQEVATYLWAKARAKAIDLTNQGPVRKLIRVRVKNAELNRKRGAGRRDAAYTGFASDADSIRPEATNPLDDVLDAESRNVLHAAIEQLGPAQRRVALRRLDGDDVPEIAARFGMTEQAVRNALNRAERSLSRLLATFVSLEGV